MWEAADNLASKAAAPSEISLRGSENFALKHGCREFAQKHDCEKFTQEHEYGKFTQERECGKFTQECECGKFTQEHECRKFTQEHNCEKFAQEHECRKSAQEHDCEKFTQEQIQEALEERHSPEVQKKLSEGRVAIAGLGGLGSNVAFALARIGVGHLHLIDFDTVDLTNLNRQQYFMEHVGLPKTEALRSELLRINPYLDIRTHQVRVTEENLRELFAGDDIVCEAFDVPENKAMLASGILEHFPEKKLVAASGMAGYESGNLIHTRRISRNFYLCGDETTESKPGHGLMAPRVAVCAAHQANMITRLILGEAEP